MRLARRRDGLEFRSPEHMVRLSGWVQDQNDVGDEYVEITQETSRRVAQMRLPGLIDRANRVLLVLVRQWPDITALYCLNDTAFDLEVLGRSYSVDGKSALVLLNLLESLGYIQNRNGAARLTPAGLLAAEALGIGHAGSAQGFVAMSFAETLRDAWTIGFDPAIRGAGFNSLRLDYKEYVGGISDDIVAEIRRSRFVVADYTGQINGVYFEAGFALGLGLTVIPTCQEDDKRNLHFDIQHLNTLFWKTPEELAVSLSRRIRTIIGTGPHFVEGQDNGSI